MSTWVTEECPQCRAHGVSLELLTTYAGYFVCQGCQHNWREPSNIVKSRLANARGSDQDAASYSKRAPSTSSIH